MTTTTAIGFDRNAPISDPRALVERTVQVGPPQPHDLLVEVRAVSVNPADVKLRAGGPSDGFRVLGFDGAGIVREIGDAVTLFRPGDEVYYAGSIDRPGTNQALHLVDERIVGRRPATLSFAEAASLPLTMLTAWEVLFERLRLTQERSGTLLVIGATGGVGAAILQLAEALLPEVTVVATASDPGRSEWARQLGAEHTVNHHADLGAQVLELAPQGVDWLFTAHSAGQIPLYATLVRPFGHIAAIDDGPRDIEPLKGRSIAWHWEFMFTRAVEHTPDMVEQHRILERLADLVDDGAVAPAIGVVLRPMTAATVREGHRLVETGHTLGKVVVAD